MLAPANRSIPTAVAEDLQLYSRAGLTPTQAERLVALRYPDVERSWVERDVENLLARANKPSADDASLLVDAHCAEPSARQEQRPPEDDKAAWGS